MTAFIGWRGNRKMSWPTFNLPAVKTCPNSTPLCRKTCYALKAEKCYPQVLPCRTDNLLESRKPSFVPDMVAQISRKRPEIFRVHESGDFYSIAYFEKWCAIAKACPETQFFAFTKRFGLFDLASPSNLVLIASIFPDTFAAVPEGVPTFTAVPKGEAGQGQHCAGNCDTCGICPFADEKTTVWTEIH